jgi:hypothetical protein
VRRLRSAIARLHLPSSSDWVDAGLAATSGCRSAAGQRPVEGGMNLLPFLVELWDAAAYALVTTAALVGIGVVTYAAFRRSGLFVLAGWPDVTLSRWVGLAILLGLVLLFGWRMLVVVYLVGFGAPA